MPKALPVKYGDGREIGDLSAQMRKYTLDCKKVLEALLAQETDLKLKLAAIKLIFDYGWGRPRPMAAPEAPDRSTITIDGRLEEIMQELLDKNADDDEAVDQDDQSKQLLQDFDGDRVGEGCPQQPEDT